MATNTAHSNFQDVPPRAPKAHRQGLTAGRAAIALAWAAAVLLMLMAIAHVAQGQVDKGSSLQDPPQRTPSASRFYSSNDGVHLADIKPSAPTATADAS
ncbi:MAG: hypothetical protein WBC18_23900 [Ottowia sp.]|uniref:hypothetical protein n=1 Tax=Ottowia sp. TaxID=1898956 RepID=UPI003C71C3B6